MEKIPRHHAAVNAVASHAWQRDAIVKRLRRILGVWELTWSFSGPDGRATFEFVTIDGELGILWRRIGDHRIFMRP
jgi:hypothetical protein